MKSGRNALPNVIYHIPSVIGSKQGTAKVWKKAEKWSMRKLVSSTRNLNSPGPTHIRLLPCLSLDKVVLCFRLD